MQRVFVSYSHDSPEHASAVRAVCDRLQRDGFEVGFDGYASPPEDGWFEWSETQIDDAQTVLVICTETYRRRFDRVEEPGKGLGASWEARTLRRLLVEERGISDKIICVLLPGHAIECIPKVLREHHRVEYGEESGHEDLASAILGLPRNVPPAGFDWLPALAGLTVSIVGCKKFATWVRWNLKAPEADDGETFHAYSQRVIRHAHAEGMIEHLLGRLTEIDGARAEQVERVRMAWQATAEVSVTAATIAGTSLDTRTAGRAKPQAGRAKEPTHTAIVLDRTTAWRTITRESAESNENLAFIVYGTHQQDLHLFMRRIQLYFAQRSGCSRPHHVLNVERDSDHTRAVTAEDWSYAAIRATRSRKGPLSDALADEARELPVLMLMSARRGPFRGLKDDAGAGLVTFLSEHLPVAMAEVSRRNPLRVLVPIEVSDPVNPPVVLELQRAMRVHRTTLTLEEPIPLNLPSWPEIEHFITSTYGELNDEAIQKCHAKYQAIVGIDHSRLHLQDLADPLHDLLVDLIRDERGGS